MYDLFSSSSWFAIISSNPSSSSSLLKAEFARPWFFFNWWDYDTSTDWHSIDILFYNRQEFEFITFILANAFLLRLANFAFFFFLFFPFFLNLFLSGSFASSSSSADCTSFNKSWCKIIDSIVKYCIFDKEKII